MNILISVRDVGEALLAAHGGADFIDLKEPRAGALGGLPLVAIRAVVQALRIEGRALALSATIGDLPMTEAGRIGAAVDAVAACGVDYVKVGIERVAAARAVLDRLARAGVPVVPVFIADRGLDWDHVAMACSAGFAGVMVDTADKLAGSLFDALPLADLQRFVAMARAAGTMVGLAGALRAVHAPMLHALAPDFAGFRSAVCIGDRTQALERRKLAQLVRHLHRDAQRSHIETASR